VWLCARVPRRARLTWAPTSCQELGALARRFQASHVFERRSRWEQRKSRVLPRDASARGAEVPVSLWTQGTEVPVSPGNCLPSCAEVPVSNRPSVGATVAGALESSRIARAEDPLGGTLRDAGKMIGSVSAPRALPRPRRPSRRAPPRVLSGALDWQVVSGLERLAVVQGLGPASEEAGGGALPINTAGVPGSTPRLAQRQEVSDSDGSVPLSPFGNAGPGPAVPSLGAGNAPHVSRTLLGELAAAAPPPHQPAASRRESKLSILGGRDAEAEDDQSRSRDEGRDKQMHQNVCNGTGERGKEIHEDSAQAIFEYDDLAREATELEAARSKACPNPWHVFCA
jgi:hypothetical protein